MGSGFITDKMDINDYMKYINFIDEHAKPNSRQKVEEIKLVDDINEESEIENDEEVYND